MPPKCCESPTFFKTDNVCLSCGDKWQCCEKPDFPKYARKCAKCGGSRYAVKGADKSAEPKQNRIKSDKKDDSTTKSYQKRVRFHERMESGL